MNDPVAVLLWLADDLDRRGYPFTGVLRQIAQALRQGHLEQGQRDQGEGGCVRCGGAVVQPSTGRRRKYCHGCAPSRKTAGNGTVAA